jgi:hypothetical protein
LFVIPLVILFVIPLLILFVIPLLILFVIPEGNLLLPLFLPLPVPLLALLFVIPEGNLLLSTRNEPGLYSSGHCMILSRLWRAYFVAAAAGSLCRCRPLWSAQ